MITFIVLVLLLQSDVCSFNKYGLQFNYPCSWIVTSNFRQYETKRGAAYRIFHFVSKTSDDEFLGTDRIAGEITAYTTSLNLDEWYRSHDVLNEYTVDKTLEFRNQELGDKLKKSDFTIESTKALISGMEAIALYTRDPGFLEGGPTTCKRYFLKKDGYIVEFSGRTITSSASDKLLSEFENLVETVRIE